MKPANWETCKDDFVFEGALIDLIVPETEPVDWETFWSALRAGPFKLRIFRDGEPIQLPDSAAEIFAERQIATVMASILAGNITANCHFFGGDIKLDIDPREIVGESEYEVVLTIMRFVAAAVRRPIFAVIEGGTPANAFLKVEPDGRAGYIPPNNE